MRENKSYRSIANYWETCVAVVGALMSTISVVQQLNDTHVFNFDTLFVVGLILLFAFAFMAILKEIRKRKDAEKLASSKSLLPSDQENSVSARDITNSPIADRGGRIVTASGNAKAAGGDLIENYHHYEQGNPPTWDDVIFSPLDGMGIVIENNKTEIIQKCRVEIIQIYNENRKSLDDSEIVNLPTAASWYENGIPHYEETDIRIGKKREFVLVSRIQLFIDDGPIYYNISGKDFQYSLSANKICFVEVEISGMTGNSSLMPKRKFVAIYFDGQKVNVRSISDDIA